jgi:hypothetical protein
LECRRAVSDEVTASGYAGNMSSLDRRISVAPMMDWTDQASFACQINQLSMP